MASQLSSALIFYEDLLLGCVLTVVLRSLAEITNNVREKHFVWLAALLQNLCALFSINGAFTDVLHANTTSAGSTLKPHLAAAFLCGVDDLPVPTYISYKLAVNKVLHNSALNKALYKCI